MITCNGKAVSKVIGCGMILKMIRDKWVIGNEGNDYYGQDRPRSPGVTTV
jgi:hypothetical protein